MVVDANIIFKAAQPSIRKVVPVENAVKSQLAKDLGPSNLWTELTLIKIE